MRNFAAFLVKSVCCAVIAVSTAYSQNALLSITTNGDIRFYLYDPQGSVADRIDDYESETSQSLFDAWGNLLAGSYDNVGYNGKSGYYTDPETGLNLCTHRYYDPSNGKWLTRDPIGFRGGMNLYGYIGNDVENGSDPSGLRSFRKWGCLELEKAINSAAAELRRLHREMLEDREHMFDDPGRRFGKKGSWEGHQARYEIRRERLAKLLSRWNELGCDKGTGGGSSLGAAPWIWVGTPAPEHPAPREFNPYFDLDSPPIRLPFLPLDFYSTPVFGPLPVLVPA